MARVFPFRGYRYSQDKIAELGDVVTQPYDKISPELYQKYLERHPQNMVHVIKNRDHQDAGRRLRQWMQNGVLKRDEQPSFYPYEQRFEFEGQTLSRTGLIGLVSLKDGSDSVKGHERVLDEQLEDRLNLIRSTESNEGLIFMLYADPSRGVDQLLSEFKQSHTPITEVVDDYQVSHRLWQLSEKDPQQQIRETLDSLPFYIADGHHRFRSALLYYQECQEKAWKAAAEESFDKRMIALFNMEGTGVRILPTHRGVRNLKDFDLSTLLSRLEPLFEIQKVDDLHQLKADMEKPGTRIGLVAGKDLACYALCLREDTRGDQTFMPAITGPARELDVNVLHEGILSPFLGIGPRELAAETHVDYFRERELLVRQLEEGQCQLAFLLNPTSLKQVYEISERGEKMPQKSTDFYPKLLTGLVLMKMEIGKRTISSES
jgi:uncharacterized protein (DUF1015 family)